MTCCANQTTENMSLSAPLGAPSLATQSPGPAVRGPHAERVGDAEPGAEHL